MQIWVSTISWIAIFHFLFYFILIAQLETTTTSRVNFTKIPNLDEPYIGKK